MQNFTRLFVTLFIILLLWSANSNAAGVGVFIDGSRGSGDAEWESGWDSWDVHTNAAAFGFVLDTAPTNEKVFNYRLNVGLVRHEFEDLDTLAVKTRGIYAENIFGFAFIKKEDFRWWFGPLVRVGYYSGDTDTVQVGPNTEKTDFDYVEFGVGAVTGLNFKIGNAILSPSIGVRFSGFAGEGETATRDSLGRTFSQREEDFDAATSNIFANFAILF